MKFAYKAVDSQGKTVSGIYEAATKQEVLSLIAKHGGHALSVHPATGKDAKKGGMQMEIKLPGGGGVKPKDLVVFTRQFSTMISAGVPITRALATLKEQSESSALKEALGQISDDVQGGMSLSDALAKHPKAFSEIYVNMVRAGEEGGILDQILGRLAMQVEKDSNIKSKFKGAMIYPAVVTGVAVIAVIFLMVGVIPKLTAILVENGGELPPQTKFIIFVSDMLITKWPILLGALAGGGFLFRRWAKTTNGRRKLHQFFLKMPIFGKITLKVNVARFARTFSSLLAAGISVNQALETTAGALSNVVVKEALLDASKMIREGHPVSDSLAESGILPQIIIQMAAVGEETGQLDTVLNKVAEFYEEEVDTIINNISSIIEPVLIVGLGSIVGFIVASVLGPITALQGSIQ